MRSAIACAWLALWPALATAADDVAAAWKISGYYKNLLMRSQTVFPAGDRYTEDLNRLRLKIEARPTESVALELQYDNEVLLGDYLDTQQFQLQKALPVDTYWNAQATYADSNDLYARHRVYRATLTGSLGATDVRIGRQRIAWGTGRFFSPLDILNPFSPIALERSERVGVDALLAEHKVDALSRASVVFAPQHDDKQSSVAALWHANVLGFDYSVVAGRFRREHVAGVDLAGQIGDAGLRAELTRSRRIDGSSYTRALLGVDYAFANTLSFSGELYHDGAGAHDPQGYDFAALFAGRVQNVGRRYAALYAGYEITPLLKFSNYFVANLNDRSRYVSPSLSYSIKANLEWAVGAQLFGGRAGSEYGTLKDMLFTQLQWFF
jgi:hypothetical protein